MLVELVAVIMCCAARPAPPVAEAEPPPAALAVSGDESEPPPAGEVADEPPPAGEIAAPAEGPAPHRHGHRRQEAVAEARGEPDCGHPGSGLGRDFVLDGHTFTWGWIERTLHGVIANHCQSKTYTDILALDGGTVGIAHFASGSLYTLYREMDPQRYFGAHAGHIPERPYRLPWWREGMRRFFRSAGAKRAEQRAWWAYIRPALGQALHHGWSSDRELAIAAGVANSLGAWGFHRIAEDNAWDAERTLLDYARRSAHKERRRQRLNAAFPAASAPSPAEAISRR